MNPVGAYISKKYIVKRSLRRKKKPLKNGLKYRFGGDGGDRTRVRKPSNKESTCLAWSI